MAQNTTWGDWFNLVTPDKLMQSLLQSGIMMARTQLDIQYGDMVVSPLSGTVSIADVTAWPLPDWDDAGDCAVEIEKLSLNGGAPTDITHFRAKVQALGVWFHAACLPPDAQQPLRMMGLSELYFPRVTFDATYDVASAGAKVNMFADLDTVATVGLTADFSYLWFDGRDDMENPDPVIFLSSAALTVENSGLWEKMQAMAPPPLTDPASAPAMVEGGLRQALMGMNASAAPEGAQPVPLNDAQEAMIASAGAAWVGFLANPQRLVLETGYASENDVYVDVLLYQDDPTVAFEDLQPRFALAPAASRNALPVGLLEAALSAPDSLQPADRLAAGEAFLTGAGAPRNMAAAMALLAPMAQAGDADAALLLSEALEARAPAQAYRWALIAGAGGAPGAAARLDRLEGTLPFGEVLALQNDVAGGATYPADALINIASIRQQASDRLSGMWLSRSYSAAAMWAMLANAAGDAEGADILNELDQRVLSGGDESLAAWDPVEAEASALATRIWVDENLPMRLSNAQ